MAGASGDVVSRDENQSLFSMAQASLRLGLLRLRAPSSRPDDECYELLERLRSCRGVEVGHVIAALPHSGLRPDVLAFLETSLPDVFVHLERFWREASLRDFSRRPLQDGQSWREHYHQQQQSTQHRLTAMRSKLRESYRGEEEKVHQLKTITVPLSRRGRLSQTAAIQRPAGKMSLMQKSRAEAISSSLRVSKSPSKDAIGTTVFRMRQPGRKSL